MLHGFLKMSGVTVSDTLPTQHLMGFLQITFKWYRQIYSKAKEIQQGNNTQQEQHKRIHQTKRKLKKTPARTQ